MKTALSTAVAAVTLISCATHKDIQVEFISAQLVKIDTVYRASGNEQLLTWRTSDNMHYVSFASMNDVYLLGTRVPVMVKR